MFVSLTGLELCGLTRLYKLGKLGSQTKIVHNNVQSYFALPEHNGLNLIVAYFKTSVKVKKSANFASWLSPSNIVYL